MQSFAPVEALAMRCRYVGRRTDALAFCRVLEQKKGESELKEANFYALPPSNMRFLVDHQDWRQAWAKACETSCGSLWYSKQQPAPLVIVSDANNRVGPPTANLKSCYAPDSTFRARVILDLDCDPDFHSTELLDCEGMFQAVCTVLQVHLEREGGIEWSKERAIFFYGSTPTKERTGHLIFCDACFLNTEENSFKSRRGKLVKKAVGEALDAALAPFGVRSDMSIATSGLRYEFTDKLEKDKTWRGGVSLPEYAWHVDVEEMLWTSMIEMIDPLCMFQDEAYNRACVWVAEVDENPRAAKAARAAAPAVRLPAVVLRDDNPTSVIQRVEHRFPQLAGQIVCKQLGWNDGADLYVTLGRWCPLRDGDHSSVGKVKIVHQLNTDRVIIGCLACESRSVPQIILQSPARELLESESADVLAEMNERYFVAPMGSRGNNKAYVWTMPLRWEDDFRFQTPTDFANGNTNHCFWYVPAGSKKAKKVTYARMWLDSSDRRTFPSGGICAPMGAPDGYFNTWRGFNPQVMKLAGDMYDMEPEALEDLCKFYVEHLRKNICGGDKDVISFVWSWLRFLFLRLDEKSGVALVLSGEPGCGKTYFFEGLLTIIGQHHSNVTHDSAAMSATFAHGKAGDMRLEVFDEATTHNDARKRGIINGLITSDKLRQERKYVDAETVKSFTNLIICSNYPRAVDAIIGERRFQCIDVAYRIKNRDKTDFFDAAHEEMKDLRSCAAFYLLVTKHFDEEFHPHNVVHNEALWRNVYLGLSGVQKWWYNCLRYGEMRTPTVRKIVRVTGNVEEDEQAEEAADKLVVKLWDDLGLGCDVGLNALRTSIQGFVRGEVPTNSEIEALLRTGNDDPLAFHVRRMGTRGDQQMCISLPTLIQCRKNFARFLQFPYEKIYSVWSHELKTK